MKRLSAFLNIPAFLNTPARVVIAVGALMLGSELLIMLLIESVLTALIKDLSLVKLASKFLDPIALTAIVSPALYFLIFRPLNQQAKLERQIDEITKRKQVEDKLVESERHFRAVTESANDAIITGAGVGNIVGWNAAAERLFGYTEAEIIGQPITVLIPERFRNLHSEGLARVAAGGAPHLIGKTAEVIGLRKGGSELPLELSLAQWQAANGQLFFTAIIRDITERRLAENKTKEAQERFEMIFNASPDAAVISRLQDGCITNVNDAFTEISGYPMGEALGSSTIGLNLWANHGDREKFTNELRTKGVCENLEAQFQSKEGKQYTGLLSAKIILLQGIQHIISFTRDITERKQAEAELRIAATAFESQDGIMVTDAHSVILRVNRAFTEITGYTAEAVGQTPRLLKSGRHDAAFYAAMWESILRTGAWHGEIWNRRKNGEVYPEQLTITVVKGDAGEVTHYVAMMHDITVRKAAEEQIYTLAFYDALTQLPNRRLLNDRLGKAMSASKRSGHYGALMFLDLDNFKPLNDTYGHGVGDLLLVEVAHRLTRCVREVDTVARFGGDEFVVMLGELDTDKAESTAKAGIIAEKIRSTLAEPYVLKTQQEGKAEMTIKHRCAASSGVVVFNSEASMEDILKWADTAMYQAKERGRNQVHFFDSKS